MARGFHGARGVGELRFQAQGALFASLEQLLSLAVLDIQSSIESRVRGELGAPPSTLSPAPLTVSSPAVRR